jgi:polyisoprenoid-binding protein YceI
MDEESPMKLLLPGLRSLALKCLVAAFASAAPVAAAQDVLVDKSEIRFVAKQLGVNVEGRFRKWKANVVFLPADLAKSKAEFDIDLASIDLASEDSEREIRGGPWFDTAKFPVAHFSSTAIRDLGGDKYEIAGALTLKGVRRDIVVPIALKKDAAGNRVAEGSFTLMRLDFNIGTGMWSDTKTVTNDVVVRVRMVLPPGT